MLLYLVVYRRDGVKYDVCVAYTWYQICSHCINPYQKYLSDLNNLPVEPFSGNTD